MNISNSKKNVLLIYPDAFKSGWLGSTRPIFKLAETLKDNGYTLVLLAKKDASSKNAAIEKSFPGNVIRTEHSGDYIKYFEKSNLLKRLNRGAWKIFGENIYWKKLHTGWAENIKIESIDRELSKIMFSPNLIWSVTGGYLDAAVAGNRLADFYNIPWVFELHDPPHHAGLSYDVSSVIKKFDQLINNASRIVVGSEIYKEILSQKIKNPANIDLIYLSYLTKTESISDENSKIFTLSYTGSLNGDRSIIPLIKAIKCMQDNKKISPENFKLIIAGKGQGIIDAQSITSKLNLTSIISIVGEVAKDEADSISSKSNAIIVIQSKDNYLQIPGKLFESLRWNKPIFGIMPEDIEAANIIKHNLLGKVCSPNNQNKICDTLTQLQEEFNNKILTTKIPEISINKFTKNAFEKNTLDLLRKLI